MKNRVFAVPFFTLLAFLIVGCQESQSPTEMSATPRDLNAAVAITRGDDQNAAHNAVLQGRDDDEADGDCVRSATYSAPLKATVGRGSGLVCVTPIAGTIGFSAQIVVKVRHMIPNASYFLQRAPEIGRPLGADGIGQRALGMYPWEQPNSPGFAPAPAFITFPLPNAGPLVMITTDAHGRGEVGFLFNSPTIPEAILFDVVFRVVDVTVNPATELRTKCFTVTVL